jgi:hypothetical protein
MSVTATVGGVSIITRVRTVPAPGEKPALRVPQRASLAHDSALDLGTTPTAQAHGPSGPSRLVRDYAV